MAKKGQLSEAFRVALRAWYTTWQQDINSNLTSSLLSTVIRNYDDVFSLATDCAEIEPRRADR
jgi:hypothetical protein